MSLLTPRPFYKPFTYSWAYDSWSMQQKLHWLPEEVPLADDVKDWQKTLTEEERHLLTQIFRFFTQADIDVCDSYTQKYLAIFKPYEVHMMLIAFANMETVHVAAYSHLLDTVGMPETEYQAFMKYQEMKDKHEYMEQFNVDSKRDVALTLAAYGAFTEGLQLFASFAMLMNFPRFGKMKGMGQIITWSVRDETLHTESIIKLFHTFVQEHPEVYDESFERDIHNICATVIKHEDAFIELAFAFEGAIKGMTADEIKQYIRFVADYRLTQLGLKPLYNVSVNPLPWMENILNAPELANFFENRATEYSKSATAGSWLDAFLESDEQKYTKAK